MTTKREFTITDVVSTEGRTYRIGPEWVTIKVPGAQSNKEYLVIEVTTPAGGGPPLHTHRAAEVFFVLEGEFEFPTIRDGEPYSVRGSTGAVVHIPAGIPHTYKNVGDSHGRLMGILMPAPEMEGFFQEAGIEVLDRSALPTIEDPLDLERLMAACEKYNLSFL